MQVFGICAGKYTFLDPSVQDQGVWARLCLFSIRKKSFKAYIRNKFRWNLSILEQKKKKTQYYNITRRLYLYTTVIIGIKKNHIITKPIHFSFRSESKTNVLFFVHAQIIFAKKEKWRKTIRASGSRDLLYMHRTTRR